MASTILERRRESWDAARTEVRTVQEKADNEDRELTADETRRMTELCDELEMLKTEIERRERLAAATAETSERKSAPQEVKHDEPSRIEFPRTRLGQLRAFRPRTGETQRDSDERAYKSGMWCRAMIWNDERAKQWCRDHGVQMRANYEGVNTYGGAIVPTEMEQSIIDLRDTYGVFRANTKVQPMSSDHMVIPRRVGGPTAYVMGENPGSGVTASQKTWDQVELTARKWGVLVQYSSELAEDAIINVADDLAVEIAYAFAKQEDDDAFNGDGTSSYAGTLGILAKMIDGSHTGSYYTAAGAANSCDTYDEVGTDDLGGIMAALPAYVYQRGNPKWFCPVAAKALVFDRLAMAASGATKAEIGSLNPTSYAGYPIVPVPIWANTGATDFSGLIAILFGDMSMATTLGDRRGTTIKVSTDRYVEYDMLAIVGTTRFDINVHDVGQGTAAGPLVGLLGN